MFSVRFQPLCGERSSNSIDSSRSQEGEGDWKNGMTVHQMEYLGLDQRRRYAGVGPLFAYKLRQ